jgi:hypothetical protein
MNLANLLAAIHLEAAYQLTILHTNPPWTRAYWFKTGVRLARGMKRRG